MTVALPNTIAPKPSNPRGRIGAPVLGSVGVVVVVVGTVVLDGFDVVVGGRVLDVVDVAVVVLVVVDEDVVVVGSVVVVTGTVVVVVVVGDSVVDVVLEVVVVSVVTSRQ